MSNEVVAGFLSRKQDAVIVCNTGLVRFSSVLFGKYLLLRTAGTRKSLGISSFF